MRLGPIVILLVAAPALARADHAPLTATTPLSPTGEVVPRGHFEHVQSGTLLFHELALGLADGLEVRLGTPLLPLPLLGGDLQVRASVLPADARLRVVIGAGVAAEWINGADAWPTASATVAWRGPRWSVHASARIAAHAGAPGERMLWNTVGATWRASARTTLFVDAGQLAWVEPGGTCVDKHGAARPCATRDAGDGVVAGVWVQLTGVAIGLMGAIGHHGDTVLPVLPLLSFRHDRDL